MRNFIVKCTRTVVRGKLSSFISQLWRRVGIEGESGARGRDQSSHLVERDSYGREVVEDYQCRGVEQNRPEIGRFQLGLSSEQ